MPRLGQFIGILHDHLTGKTATLVSRAGGKSTISKEYTSNQTALALITPSEGKRLQIAGVYASADTNTGEIQLDFVTSEIKVFRLYASKYYHSDVLDCADKGAVDEPLSLTTTTGDNKAFVKVNYREVD